MICQDCQHYNDYINLNSGNNPDCKCLTCSEFSTGAKTSNFRPAAWTKLQPDTNTNKPLTITPGR